MLLKMLNNYNLMDSSMEFVHEESSETHYDLQDDIKEDVEEVTMNHIIKRTRPPIVKA
jgi:hypothetical protein